MRLAMRTRPPFGLVRALAAAVMAALAGLLASCTSSGAVSSTAASASSAGKVSVVTLNRIDTLKSLFNRDDGRTRLILIFSPT
jgi:hypothetical protein